MGKWKGDRQGTGVGGQVWGRQGLDGYGGQVWERTDVVDGCGEVWGTQVWRKSLEDRCGGTGIRGQM